MKGRVVRSNAHLRAGPHAIDVGTRCARAPLQCKVGGVGTATRTCWSSGCLHPALGVHLVVGTHPPMLVVGTHPPMLVVHNLVALGVGDRLPKRVYKDVQRKKKRKGKARRRAGGGGEQTVQCSNAVPMQCQWVGTCTSEKGQTTNIDANLLKLQFQDVFNKKVATA
jgi:hypothetical protein